jgi:hypothetical protein
MEVDYVRVYQQGALDIKMEPKEPMIQLFPNPVTDHLIIKNTENTVGSKVTVYTILGQELNSFVLDTTETILDVSHYQNGIYFIQINTKSGIQTNKFVKK